MNIRNRSAFLSMLAISEGTFNCGDNGYNVLCGGDLFHSYADHPRILINLPRLKIKSSAAGRYQIKKDIFDFYKNKLGLHDFSPTAQDRIAIQLIEECHALDDIDAGRFAEAVKKCRSRWASLPLSGYGQHENKIDDLQIAYVHAGGFVA